MSHPPLASRSPCRNGGFTLIEVMIAVAVVALLVAVALPSYQSSIRKGRRAEAFHAVSAVQQAQERWRGSHIQYADNSQLTLATGGTPPGLGLLATTPSGYYTIDISSASGTLYVVTATAAGSQASDTNCAKMAAKVDNGNGTLSYGAGPSSIDYADPNRCWAR